jgi:PhzF family phenazine biosynthesis protein
LRIFQVDAFTRTRFTGNPATVVLDADGQSDATMMSVAREFAHADVAFVLAATAPDHDVHLRFFNARKEVPFVGHATIAAHAVLLALGRRAHGPVRQHSGTGIIEVRAHEFRQPTGSETTFEFRQSIPELDSPLPFKTTLRVAEALRLPAIQLHEVMPARIAHKGSSRLLVPIGDPRALDAIAPNFETLISIGAELGTEGFFVFGLNPGAGTDELSTESRMFCPALGIPEDPVSGNAHAMLASYLFELGQFGKHSTGFIGHQGRQMKRPGRVSVKLEIDQGSLIATHIGGNAIIVSEGTLAL